MELSIENQADRDDEQHLEYECDEGWFDIYLPPGSYWMSVAAITTSYDQDLDWTIEHLAGSSPAIGVVVGDGNIVVAPFLVDVGR